MGPLGLLLLNGRVKRLMKTADPAHLPDGRKGGLTLIQLKALNQLRKGWVQPLETGVMTLLPAGKTAPEDGLFRARFRPGGPKSVNIARCLCLEVARQRYRFDLLFVKAPPFQESVAVLCPHCRQYWTWHESSPNNLLKRSGRLCTACAPSPAPAADQ